MRRGFLAEAITGAQGCGHPACGQRSPVSEAESCMMSPLGAHLQPVVPAAPPLRRGAHPQAALKEREHSLPWDSG